MNELFRKFSHKASETVGSSWAFFMAFSVILVWITTGPVFQYSDTWQLFINTGTTIVTFLMVFLIQNAQNRDAKATHLKLDELIRASNSRNKLIDAEELSDKDLKKEKNKIITHHIAKQKITVKNVGTKNKNK